MKKANHKKTKEIRKYNRIMLNLKYYYYENKKTKVFAVKNNIVIDLFLEEFNLTIQGNRKQFFLNLLKNKENKVISGKYKKKSSKTKKRTLKGITKEYRQYLNSPEWKKLRESFISHKGSKCEKCGSESNLQVHHLHYKNIFKEKFEDLMVLCKSCHRKEHKLD